MSNPIKCKIFRGSIPSQSAAPWVLRIDGNPIKWSPSDYDWVRDDVNVSVFKDSTEQNGADGSRSAKRKRDQDETNASLWKRLKETIEAGTATLQEKTEFLKFISRVEGRMTADEWFNDWMAEMNGKIRIVNIQYDSNVRGDSIVVFYRECDALKETEED